MSRLDQASSLPCRGRPRDGRLRLGHGGPPAQRDVGPGQAEHDPDEQGPRDGGERARRLVDGTEHGAGRHRHADDRRDEQLGAAHLVPQALHADRAHDEVHHGEPCPAEARHPAERGSPLRLEDAGLSGRPREDSVAEADRDDGEGRDDAEHRGAPGRRPIPVVHLRQPVRQPSVAGHREHPAGHGDAHADRDRQDVEDDDGRDDVAERGRAELRTGRQVLQRERVVLPRRRVAAVSGVLGVGGHQVVRPDDGQRDLDRPGDVPLGFGGLNLLYGVLYGINMFIGFESAANLAEEAAEPKRHIPRAVLLSLTIVGAYYLVTAYAQDAGYGLYATAWKNNAFPLQNLASGSEFGSAAFGNVVSAIVILDVLAVTIGVGVAVTRGMFSMARDGRLPNGLAEVHHRYRTPVRCAAVLGIVSALAIVAVRRGDGILTRATGQPGVLQPQWAPAIGWMAGFGGTGLAVMYLVVSAVGVKGLRHQVSRATLLVVV